MSEAETTPAMIKVADDAASPRLPHPAIAYLQIVGWRLLIVVAGLSFWQFASGRLIKAFWISSPSDIWKQLADWIVTGDLWINLEVTLTETVLGFLFGAVAGVLFGLALGLNRRLAAVLDPFIVAFYSLPK